MANSPILDACERPSTPSDWKHRVWTVREARAEGLYPPNPPVDTHDGIGYDFTWHHNIPWRTLKLSRKIACVFCAWPVFEQSLDLYGMRTCPLIKSKLKALREQQGPTQQPADERSYAEWVRVFDGLDLGKNEIEQLCESVAWQRWNIVEGPKESIRVEDPGSDDFDDFSRADPAHFDRCMAVERLFNALEELMSDYKVQENGKGDFNDMTGVWSAKPQGPVLAAQILIDEPLVMFEADHWRVMHWGGKVKDKIGTTLTSKAIPSKTCFMVRTRRCDE